MSDANGGGRPPSMPGWAAYRTPVQQTSPPKPRRRVRAMPVVITVVALGLICGLGIALAGVRSDLRELRDEALYDRSVDAVRDEVQDRQAESATGAVNGLSERLGRLEARVDDQPDLAKVASKVEPSVFTVLAGRSQGSGFVFQKAGTTARLVTNYHVVEAVYEGGERRVELAQDRRRLQATIDRVDTAVDLAVLIVEADLTVVERASRAPVVGDPVVAFGSPLGLGGSASSGIVSALRSNRIQFSAPVSPGNSGGPLVDRQGKAIGVTQSKLVETAAEGLSFAISIEVVCTTVLAC